jgi:tetratricopeptide (TPR) repeat protein
MGTTRFRRSIKIAPGLKVNLTKKGVGLTAGVRGAHYSVHSSGRRTATVGIPGSGLYYQDRTSGHSTKAHPSGPHPASGATHPLQPSTRIDPAQVIPKPGLFASGPEKAYHSGVLAYLGSNHEAALADFERVTAADPSAASAHLFAGSLCNALGYRPRAIAHFEAVVSGPHAIPDRYQAKYLADPRLALHMSITTTDSITATPPFDALGAALALADVYKSAGKLEEAIGLIQQLEEASPDPLVRLTLCDLLFADKDYEGVVEASVGVANASDIDVETLHLRAAALVSLGHNTAAMDSFRDALAKTANRDPGLLNAVRYDRALAFEQAGQQAKAKADLERIYAADPKFSDVRDRLAAMG